MFYSKKAFYNDYIKVTEDELEAIIETKTDDYTILEIPKKSGVRTICAIDSACKLYEIQKNLTNHFLTKINLPQAAKGFVERSSYKQYLYPHKGNGYFLRIDIKDFFNSIKEDLVIERLNDIILITDSEEKEEVIHKIIDICLLDHKVPQGAVTSPVLSNIVFARLDQRITKYCQAFNIIYTRYADDLLFSSYNFDFKIKPWFLKKIKFILSSKNFKLNYDKTKIMEDEISLNGFVVGKDIRLSRKRLSDIMNIIIYCEKDENKPKDNLKDDFLYNINNLSLKFRIKKGDIYFSSIEAFKNYLCGCRAYLISWLDDSEYNTNQKHIKKTINRIQNLITNVEKTYDY